MQNKLLPRLIYVMRILLDNFSIQPEPEQFMKKLGMLFFVWFMCVMQILGHLLASASIFPLMMNNLQSMTRLLL